MKKLPEMSPEIMPEPMAEMRPEIVPVTMTEMRPVILPGIIPRMIPGRLVKTLALLAIVTSTACQQAGLYDYSTPEATYNTYREQARTLRVAADHRHYRRAIRCFTDDDWEWFEENFETIPADREEGVYEYLYRTKKQAYVFGRGVVPHGPPLDEERFTFTDTGAGAVELRVEGYPRVIRFVPSSRGWAIEGVFGLRETRPE